MYEGYNAGRLKLEQGIAERGRRDRVLDNPHATDEELWEIGTAVMYAQFGTWVDSQVAGGLDSDAYATARDMLDDLRQVYDGENGRLSDRIDLYQLAKALRMLDVAADVRYDCGGQWFIHAGPTFTDAEGVEVPAITVGGDLTVEDRRRDAVWCLVDGMSYGTGDRKLPDAEQIQHSVDEKRWRVAELAELIAKAVNEELKRRGFDAEAWAEHHKVLEVRVGNAAAAAENAFWSAAGARFPEIKTGDMDPGLAMSLERLMKRAVADWAECSGPEGLPWAAGTTAPVILEPTAEQAAHAADLVRRAEQMAGRELRPGNGGQEAEHVSIFRMHKCGEDCGNEAHPRDGRVMTQCNGCGAEDDRCCDCKRCDKAGCVCTTGQQ